MPGLTANSPCAANLCERQYDSSFPFHAFFFHAFYYHGHPIKKQIINIVLLSSMQAILKLYSKGVWDSLKVCEKFQFEEM